MDSGNKRDLKELSSASAKGRRAEQQDRYALHHFTAPGLEGHFLGVMDGHGGQRVAEIAAHTVIPVFEKKISVKLPLDQALRETVNELARTTAKEHSGSTLSLVFIPKPGQKAYVAVLGDSPVIMRDNTGEIWVSPLHNVRSNMAERQAAVDRGARYAAGYIEDAVHPVEGLQLSRSLGDAKVSHLLNRDPDMATVSLGRNSFVLLATDGIFDAIDENLPGQIEYLSGLIQRGADAEELVGDALQRRTGDNVTAILWRALIK